MMKAISKELALRLDGDAEFRASVVSYLQAQMTKVLDRAMRELAEDTRMPRFGEI